MTRSQNENDARLAKLLQDDDPQAALEHLVGELEEIWTTCAERYGDSIAQDAATAGETMAAVLDHAETEGFKASHSAVIVALEDVGDHVVDDHAIGLAIQAIAKLAGKRVRPPTVARMRHALIRIQHLLIMGARGWVMAERIAEAALKATDDGCDLCGIEDAATANGMRFCKDCDAERALSEECVVNGILAELNGRKGFGWWWDDIDDETQREIEDALRLAIREYL